MGPAEHMAPGRGRQPAATSGSEGLEAAADTRVAGVERRCGADTAARQSKGACTMRAAGAMGVTIEAEIALECRACRGEVVAHAPIWRQCRGAAMARWVGFQQ